MPTKILKEITEFFGKKLDAIANAKFQSEVTVQAKFPEIQKIDIPGIEILTLKGDKGDKGDRGADGESVVGLKGADGRDGVDGKDGRDGVNGTNGKDGIDGKDGRDGSSDTGEEIVDKINKDKSGGNIKKEHIEGLLDIESLARTADANSRSFMNTGSYVYAYDLSASLDGVTKTFALPANARVILAFGSSAPGVFRPTVDYTTTASTITFTSEIAASSTLATGQTVIILYKIL